MLKKRPVALDRPRALGDRVGQHRRQRRGVEAGAGQRREQDAGDRVAGARGVDRPRRHAGHVAVQPAAAQQRAVGAAGDDDVLRAGGQQRRRGGLDLQLAGQRQRLVLVALHEEGALDARPDDLDGGRPRAPALQPQVGVEDHRLAGGQRAARGRRASPRARRSSTSVLDEKKSASHASTASSKRSPSPVIAVRSPSP